MDIVALLQPIEDSLSKATLRHLHLPGAALTRGFPSKKPDDILVAQLFRNAATLGSLHITKAPVSSP
jgi:hypothetical protein